jgi:hypothetical protein
MHYHVCRETAMLKITNRATGNTEIWILCGRLAGPWVAEFRANWDEVRGWSRSRRFVIDLSEVTLIDESGEALLAELRDEGAEFTARGVYTRHLLENLKSRSA